jgi:hypothetical protein
MAENTDKHALDDEHVPTDGVQMGKLLADIADADGDAGTIMRLIDAFAAGRVAEATAWRSIETAPRDGSEIDLFIPYDRNVFNVIECESYGRWDGHCFRHKGDDGPDDIQPTHWRHPLPPPPEGK